MKAFVIYLPDRPHSVSHANEMIATLTSYDINAELFEGTNGTNAVKLARNENRVVYPYSIKSQQVGNNELEQYIRPELWEEFKQSHTYKVFKKQGLGTDLEKMLRPGVIGCFYSHYNLWKKCVKLNEPIMIFEDDVKFYRKWYPVDWEGVLILSLGKSSFSRDPWKSFLEAPTGYPNAVKWHNYSMPGASGYAIKPKTAKSLIKFYRNYFYPADNAINASLCEIHAHNYMMGRNMIPDEGNISMTKATDW
jgi:GR25 family glycosyltransferase involved in LPS biosynthesis